MMRDVEVVSNDDGLQPPVGQVLMQLITRLEVDDWRWKDWWLSCLWICGEWGLWCSERECDEGIHEEVEIKSPGSLVHPN